MRRNMPTISEPMVSLELLIANKAYSSWSMRPWMLLEQFGIPFEEIVVPLDQPDSKARMRAINPAGKAPALVDGDIAVWELAVDMRIHRRAVSATRDMAA